MKTLFYKIALWIIGIISILFLLFYTFSSSKNDKNFDNNFEITKIWTKTSSWLTIDKINFYTTIYSKQKDYKIEKNNIKLGSWVYLIDSRDVFSTFDLYMWKTKIIISWAGLVYVNNNSGLKTIFSLNNKIKVELINQKTQKKWVEVFLYPHMYIKFLEKRIKVEKADAFYASKLLWLSYFNWTFNDLLKQNNIIRKKENKIFFNSVIKNIINNQKKYSQKLENFKKLNLANKWLINFLENYFSIFYNDRKKVVYYQNKILDNIYKLFINLNDRKSVNNILKYLEKIKILDNQSYNKSIKLIKEIYFLVSYDLSKNSDIAQNNFDNLFSKILKIKDNRTIKIIKDVDRYNYFWDFSKYLKLLSKNIEIINSSLKTKKTQEEEYLENLSKQYYFLFKQQVLISNFSKEKIENNNFILLIDWFISYANSIDENISVDNKETYVSNVIDNYELLKVFEQKIKNKFFEEKRNSQNLLIFKKNIFKISKIKQLEDSIKIFFEKYKKAKKYLLETEVHKAYVWKYLQIEKVLKEDLTALQDYSIYKKKYSIVNKELLWVKVYNDDKDKSLTKEKFIKYISYFNWVDLSSLSFEVHKFYYSIKNISINNKNFSFDLIPSKWNLIKNIVYKDKIFDSAKQRWFYNFLESTSYSLDEQKEKYKKLFEKAKQEEKEKYDFKNFFSNNFFFKENKKVDDFVLNNKDKNQDDEIIQTFKRAKLLWPKWEFRNIRDFLKFNYFNLDVKRTSWKNFSIKIKNAKIEKRIEERNYFIEFNSDYKLTNTSHYFYNIKLKIYLKQNWDKKAIFWNAIIKLRWLVDISEFKQKINELIEQIPEIKKDFNEIAKNKNINFILYSVYSKKYYIK